MMTLARVRLPTFDVVPPNVIVAFPSVAVLLDNWLLVIPLSVPPSVRLPDVVTVPVKVMPLTVPAPDTCVTVPLPLPPPPVIATVFNMITSRPQA